jgi:CRP-like cAMP-binding protein
MAFMGHYTLPVFSKSSMQYTIQNMSVENHGAPANNNFQPSIVKIAKGSFFVVEGKADTHRFFILQEGNVRISREVDRITGEGESVVGPGDIIAAVSVMAGYSFIETAVTCTDATMIAVEKRQYSSLIRANTPIAVKIIQQFSQRLRTLDDILSRLTVSATAVNEPAHLFNVAEYYTNQRKFGQACYAYQQYAAHCPDAANIETVNQKISRITPNVKTLRPTYPSNKVERVYPGDCLLFAEGEPGHELYVIQEGSVKISKIVNNQEVILAVLRKGDIFGEMALLEDKPRTANAEILEECTVLAVNRANFEGLIKTSPELVARLTTLLAERIWLMYRQLANTMIENPLDRIYDALLIQLEKERVPVNTNKPYLCNFGFKELAEMARIPPREQDNMLRKLFSTKRFNIVKDKLFVCDPSEVLKQVGYSRRTIQRNSANPPVLSV